MTVSAYSQTSPQVKKAINDPKRAEKEAKADVYIQQTHIITDSVQTSTTINSKTGTKKKRNCSRKSARS